jgi:putative membrane protein
MTSNTTDRQLVWVVLAIVTAFILVPAFGMMGAGPMMGGMWGDHMWGASGTSGWMLALGVGMQLLFLAAIFGVAYLAYPVLTSEPDSSDSALEEARTAYARGDLSDDEFEERRVRLRPNS